VLWTTRARRGHWIECKSSLELLGSESQDRAGPALSSLPILSPNTCSASSASFQQRKTPPSRNSPSKTSLSLPHAIKAQCLCPAAHIQLLLAPQGTTLIPSPWHLPNPNQMHCGTWSHK
jgi:hypothetical protein